MLLYGGGIQGDPQGTAETFLDKLDNQLGGVTGPQCTASYTAGPPDSNHYGGSYSFSTTLQWYGGNEAKVTHTVSGLVDCPKQ